MNKPVYLKRLNSALRWNLKAKEIRDILSDYDGFFDKAVSEGKSEEQICAELGNPETIARDIISEMAKKITFHFVMTPKVIWKILLGAILVAIAALFFFSLQSGENILFSNITGMIIFIGVLWFFLTGSVIALPPMRYQKKYKLKWLPYAFHLGLALIIAVSFTIFRIAESEISVGALSTLTAPIMNYCYNGFTVIAFLITAYSFHGFYFMTPYYFAVSCHAIGVIVFLRRGMHLFGHVGTLDALNFDINMLFVIYAVSAIMAIAYTFLIRILAKRA